MLGTEFQESFDVSIYNFEIKKIAFGFMVSSEGQAIYVVEQLPRRAS